MVIKLGQTNEQFKPIFKVIQFVGGRQFNNLNENLVFTYNYKKDIVPWKTLNMYIPQKTLNYVKTYQCF